MAAISKYFDLVADAGCVGGGVDEWQKVQRCFDRFLPDAPLGKDQTGGVVHLPAIDRGIMVGKPVFIEGDRVTFCGDGLASKIVSNNHMPPIVVGLRRYTPLQPNGATPLNRPEVTALLDGTAGQRWGVRAAGKVVNGVPDPATTVYPTFDAGPLTLGRDAGGVPRPDFWQETPKSTWDLAIHFSSLANPFSQEMGGYLFGSGVDPGNPERFFVRAYVQGGKLVWMIKAKTVDPADWHKVETRNVFFSSPPNAGPGPEGMNRLSIQFDTSTGIVLGFVGGSQVFKGQFCTPGNIWPKDFRFPFTLGCVAPAYGGTNSVYPNATFCGLKASADALYADDGVGTRQRRLDGRPINDLVTYFDDSPSSSSVCTLPLTDQATDHAKPLDGNRLVVVAHGGKASYATSSYGFLLAPDNVNVFNTSIRDMTVANYYGMSPIYGMAISPNGMVQECVGVDMNGGAFGFGTWISQGATYPVYTERCRANGRVAAFFGVEQIGHHVHFNIGYPGEYSLYLVGCSGEFNFAVTGDHFNTDYLVYCEQTGYGADLFLRRWVVDFEYATNYPKRGIFYIQQSTFTGSNVVIEDMGGGAVGKGGAPFMVLDGPDMPSTGNSNGPPGRVRIRRLNYNADPNCQAVIDVYSRGWHVDVRDSWLPKQCPTVRVRTPDGTHSCRVIHTGYNTDADLADGRVWTAGVDVREVRNHQLGKPVYLYCVKSGTGIDAGWAHEGVLA